MPEADLILASGSPRRRELMALTGLRYQVDAPEVDEHTDLPAREAVALLSRRKACASAAAHPGRVILAADTLVAVDGRPLGKPVDAEDARRMLHLLSGRWHEVYTGVAAVDATGELHTGVETARVRFATLSDTEIDAYIATGEPMDKAGAYAIQGIAGLFVEEVQGSPSCIIGLPMALTVRLLRACGLPVLGVQPGPTP